MYMRILFVLSASLWAFLVGRCIAFGPKLEIITWIPTFKTDSWYNLTDITAKIPHKLLKYTSTVIATCSVPILFIDNDLIHCSMALILVSEHCYLPMFVERMQDTYWKWPFINIILNALFLWLLPSLIVQISLIIKIVIHVLFMYIEIKLVHNIVREVEPYDGRHPRIV